MWKLLVLVVLRIWIQMMTDSCLKDPDWMMLTVILMKPWTPLPLKPQTQVAWWGLHIHCKHYDSLFHPVPYMPC